MHLIILGSGGYGRTIADLTEQSNNYTEILFLDDKTSIAISKLVEFESFIDLNTAFYPVMGKMS